MNKGMIVLAVAIVLVACNNSSVESSAATKSVDSATKAAPDTIKPIVLDSAVRSDSGHRKL
jgi:hypothetical protein